MNGLAQASPGHRICALETIKRPVPPSVTRKSPENSIRVPINGDLKRNIGSIFNPISGDLRGRPVTQSGANSEKSATIFRPITGDLPRDEQIAICPIDGDLSALMRNHALSLFRHLRCQECPIDGHLSRTFKI